MVQRGPRVLSVMIAEDSEVTRKTIRRLIAELGYKIESECKNGVEAVYSYYIKKSDIVILDINMPNGSGLTALQMILEINPKAKVVMLTTQSNSDTVLKAIKIGAYDYVTKDKLNTRLKEALDKIKEKLIE